MSTTIGNRIKQIRNSKKMTLKQLAELSGLSIGYLSQVERGKSSIAMNQLSKLADCLEVNIQYFITEDSNNDCPVMKTYENSILFIESELSLQYRVTSSFHDKEMLPKIDILMPGFDTEPMHNHKGEEFIYILEGVMTFELDGKTFTMYPGDTAHYNAMKIHRWANDTTKPVKVLMVSTPNPFKAD